MMDIVCSATLNANADQERQPSIVAVKCIQEMQTFLDLADKNTLVIFDIDSTLTTPSNQILQRQSIQRYKDFYDSVFNPLTEEEKRIFLHLVVIDSPSILVEQGYPALIRELQKKNVTVIAFTASKTGSLGDMESFPQWRFNELKRLGIDFSSAFPGKVLFKDLQDLSGDFPGIEKGIVYSGYANSKGAVFPYVVNTLKLPINKIIYIDDKETNIRSVLDAAKDYFSVENLIGLHYLGINNITKTDVEFHNFEQHILGIIDKTKLICRGK